MRKPHRLIKGADVSTLKKGERGNLILYNGEMIKTSPIVNCFYSGSYVYVETENTIYETYQTYK